MKLALVLLLCGCGYIEEDQRREAQRILEHRRTIAAEAITVCLTLCGDAGVRKMEIKSFDWQPICECR